jgi:hypothetical protein
MAHRRSRRASRKSHKRSMRRHKKGSRRHMRGGVAPITYSLAGSWPSKMSLGQGGDYESYHVGQHGGSAPFPAAVSGTPLIPTDMDGPAMVSGTLKAYQDVAGLRDPPFDSMPVATQKGAGRRRKSRKSRKGSKKGRKGSRKMRKSTHRRRKMRGGSALGYASVNAPGMLLSSASAYSQAGLNPGYITGDLEAQMAAQRGDKN